MVAVAAGRAALHHRLTAQEAAHDLLGITPDLDPITELCPHDGYQHLADGTPARIVLPDFDSASLQQRGIPEELVDESGALLLEPGTLAGLGVAAGDLVGLRLTEHGIALEAVAAITGPSVGAPGCAPRTRPADRVA